MGALREAIERIRSAMLLRFIVSSTVMQNMASSRQTIERRSDA